MSLEAGVKVQTCLHFEALYVSWIFPEDRYYLQKAGQDFCRRQDSPANYFVQGHISLRTFKPAKKATTLCSDNTVLLVSTYKTYHKASSLGQRFALQVSSYFGVSSNRPADEIYNAKLTAPLYQEETS